MKSRSNASEAIEIAAAMTDHDLGKYLTTDNPFWYKHECIGAYLYGSELSARANGATLLTQRISFDKGPAEGL